MSFGVSHNQILYFASIEMNWMSGKHNFINKLRSSESG